MWRVGIFLIVISCLPGRLYSQPNIVFSTSLPLVLIDTRGNNIPDEPKVQAEMKIIDKGPGFLNSYNDLPTGYNGNIGIEIRGSSSQMFPQKQYAIELWSSTLTDTSAVILGMPAEEDWILQGPYTDKSLMRNVLTYKLGADMGWYAPRTRFCEVYINGYYSGVYFMTEKIKRDKNRVNISKLNPDENSGDDLTGGYIVKIDKFDGATQGRGWDSPYTVSNTGGTKTIHFQYHYPAEDDITPAQETYIRNVVSSFEGTLYSTYFLDPQNGYRKYINIDSFIDFAIMNELTKNVDGYRLSTFLYKDRNSKDGRLHIGPLWDFNLAFGNADYCQGGNTSGWAWDFNDYCGGDYWVIPSWWDRFLKDRDYLKRFRERWFQVRQGTFSNESIMHYIDSTAVALEQSQQRHYGVYPILDQYVWPNNFIGGSYAAEIGYLKSWITQRLAWLDANIGTFAMETGIDDGGEASVVTVFPNPSHGAFQIQFTRMPESTLQVSLIDRLGKTCFSDSYHPDDLGQGAITVEGAYAPGFYILKLTSDNRLLLSQKVIIK